MNPFYSIYFLNSVRKYLRTSQQKSNRIFGLFINSVKLKLYVNLVFSQFYLIEKSHYCYYCLSKTFLCEDSTLDLSAPET